MNACKQELCPNWSGEGDVCPCAIFDLPRPFHGGQCACDDCMSYDLDVDDDSDLDPCNHCPHDNTDHRGDGCLHCGCDVPQ